MTPSPLVFITGASSGIGQALAASFYDAGYRLALVARRTGEIESWAAARQLSADRYRIYSADVAQTFATNNVGLAATFHPFVRAMVQRGSGRLVGIGSVASIRGLPGHGAYCASKAGVVAYCESLRGELHGSGVKVITLCPGYIDTPLTQGNRYGMPFLMKAEDFAAQALRAIEAGTSYRVIPWQMGVVAKIMRMLPNAVLDRAVQGRARKKRSGEA